jgi:hypothetical protein
MLLCSPYHHSGHACDVMQATSSLLGILRQAKHPYAQCMTPLEELALLLAGEFSFIRFIRFICFICCQSIYT